MSLVKWASCLAVAAALVTYGSTSVRAHEFWIEPQAAIAATGDTVPVDLKVGLMLKGVDYPFLSEKFKTFTVTAGGGTQPVEGVEGDVPALQFEVQEPGLNIFSLETLPLEVTFETFEQYNEYLVLEGLGNIASKHLARALPKTGIVERYIRCSKALLPVSGSSSPNTDLVTGLPFELVAQSDPYDAGVHSLRVQLLWHGSPVPNRQISVFRNKDAPSRSTVITDSSGTAEVPLDLPGFYLLNAVNIEPVTDSQIMWESHWASLTFVRK